MKRGEQNSTANKHEWILNSCPLTFYKHYGIIFLTYTSTLCLCSVFNWRWLIRDYNKFFWLEQILKMSKNLNLFFFCYLLWIKLIKLWFVVEEADIISSRRRRMECGVGKRGYNTLTINWIITLKLQLALTICKEERLAAGRLFVILLLFLVWCVYFLFLHKRKEKRYWFVKFETVSICLKALNFGILLRKQPKRHNTTQKNKNRLLGSLLLFSPFFSLFFLLTSFFLSLSIITSDYNNNIKKQKPRGLKLSFGWCFFISSHTHSHSNTLAETIRNSWQIKCKN